MAATGWKRTGVGKWTDLSTGKEWNSDVDPSKHGGVPQWQGKVNAKYAAAQKAATPAAGATPALAQTPEAAKKAQQDAAIGKLLGPGTEGAAALADRFFGEGSLGRMDYMSPEERAIPGEYKAQYDKYKSGAPSADVQDILNRYKAGLEGYNSQELTGMREQAMRGVDSQYATSSRRAAISRAASGVRGPAGLAQQAALDRDRINAQSNMEQDLFVKNADEKQRRLGEYSNVLGNVEKTAYDRAGETLAKYGNALAAVRTDDVATKGYNDQKLADEKAGSFGTYFGALNLGLAKQGQAEDFALNNEYLKIAKKRYGSTGGNKKATTAAATPTANPYYQDAINLIKGS